MVERPWVPCPVPKTKRGLKDFHLKARPVPVGAGTGGARGLQKASSVCRKRRPPPRPGQPGYLCGQQDPEPSPRAPVASRSRLRLIRAGARGGRWQEPLATPVRGQGHCTRPLTRRGPSQDLHSRPPRRPVATRAVPGKWARGAPRLGESRRKPRGPRGQAHPSQRTGTAASSEGPQPPFPHCDKTTSLRKGSQGSAHSRGGSGRAGRLHPLGLGRRDPRPKRLGEARRMAGSWQPASAERQRRQEPGTGPGLHSQPQ